MVSTDIRGMLTKGIELLRNAGIETPVVEAGVILCHVLNCDRAYLYTHGEREVSRHEADLFLDAVKKRSQGIPVQYITGHQEFMSIDFEVGPGVLIPRADTEILAEKIIEHGEKLVNGNPARVPEILDIGTGSGCIAVSAAFYIRSARITAVDVSPAALEIASRNALKAGVRDRIRFLKSDLFSCLESEGGAFDIIASNPPYIPSGDIEGLMVEVGRHEPLAALDGGADGLDFYRAIIDRAPRFLKEEGILAFEVGQGQAEAVCGLMSGSFGHIGTHKDIAGIDRVVLGKLL